MTDLLALAAELVAVPSVSGNEEALCDLVQGHLRSVPWLEVTRIGHNLVARSSFGLPVRVALAGHLDTVPPNANAAARVEGDALWGLGAADMKGGLAVMVDLAITLSRPTYDLTFVFYACEEVAREHSGLLAIARAAPHLVDDAQAAIVCEPTSSRVEAGCQGVVKAVVDVAGTSAHVARPWTGTNAAHRLAPVVDAVASWPGRCPVLDGCTYREALQVVGLRSGGAWNVVPASAQARLNYRFAPDQTEQQAAKALEAYLKPVLGPVDRLEIVDSSPAASPNMAHPVLARLAELSGAPVTAKLGWTDVAFFAERGIPAANFGPGDGELAHKSDERVTRGSLFQARQVIGTLLGQGS